MKLAQVILLSALTFGTAALAEGQPVLMANQDSVFDQSEKLRVDQAIIILDAADYVMEFRASSMDKECDFTGSRAAWLNVQMVGSDHQVLGPMRQVKVASVTSAGGYEAHRVNLTDLISVALIKLSTSFNMAMPGRANC